MKSQNQTESTCPSDVDLWEYLDISSVRMKILLFSTQMNIVIQSLQVLLDNDCSLKIKCGIHSLPKADFETEGFSMDIPNKDMIMLSATDHPDSELLMKIFFISIEYSEVSFYQCISFSIFSFQKNICA